MYLILLISLASVTFATEDVKKNPIYKYRYQTEDFMKTSASEIPIHGYHTVEGRYYPENNGYRQNFDRYQAAPSNFGYQNFVPFRQNFGFDNYYRPFYNQFGGINNGINGGFNGYQGGFVPHHHPRAGFVDKKAYNDEKKNVEDEKFEKAEGSRGESGGHGKAGFSKGEVALKDAKADSGFYKDEQGFKKGFDDNKEYYGGNHFNHNGM